MTEEEIRPIAENYVEEYCHCSDGEYTDGSLVCAGIGTALIVSRQLEKQITDLEKELEQAKKVQVVEHFEAYGQCRDSRRIAVLENENRDLRDNYDQFKAIAEPEIERLQKKNAELNDEVRKLKLLVSSLVYEINQIWDINEINDDLRMCAEKIDREVQLSKMAEDNRMVISALGFAIVPPKPELNVKEI